MTTRANLLYQLHQMCEVGRILLVLPAHGLYTTVLHVVPLKVFSRQSLAVGLQPGGVFVPDVLRQGGREGGESNLTEWNAISFPAV